MSDLDQYGDEGGETGNNIRFIVLVVGLAFLFHYSAKNKKENKPPKRPLAVEQPVSNFPVPISPTAE